MSKSIESEQIVQAILIADSFNENFVPFTSGAPLALLPLANVPLIEYSFEVLNRNGVEEVVVFCRNHTNQVKRFIQQRREEKCTWSMKMSITIIGSEACRCLGEALRDLEARHIIGGNVILLGVDSVTNANLAVLLEHHKRRVKLDRGAVMTVVYKETGQRLRTGNEVIVAMDASTRRLLYHQRLTFEQPQRQRERNFNLPLELFVSHRNVTVCHGLLDPQIAICSQAALPLFADNFDFLTRDDFMQGVLINGEILRSRIYVVRLTQGEYAMRINNWQSYQLVSLDVLNRWVYPLVPDMIVNHLHQRHYKRYRNNIYHQGDVKLHMSCELVGDLVVDENVSIEEDTSIGQTVIGRGCTIGRRCYIRNCFLFEGAIVGDDCVLDHCIIGRGVKVGTGCHIRDGTVLGDGVEIPDGLKFGKLLVQATQTDGEWWDGAAQKLAERAYTVPQELSDEEQSHSDADEEVVQHFNQPVLLATLRSTYSPSIYQPSDDEANSEPPSPVQADDAMIFLSEVVESLQRGLAEQIAAEYLILEINSSRYAYNMSLGDVNFHVVQAILQILVMQEGVATNAVGILCKLLAYFDVVFRNYIRDQAAMLDCLRAFEEMSQSNEIVRKKIALLLHHLYEADLVDGKVIMQWYDDVDDETLKKTLSKFVEWLSDESSGEDENDG